MIEGQNGSGPEALLAAQEAFKTERIEALKDSGFSEWFLQFETQLQEGLIPSLTSEEGYLCAERFSNLEELQPSQPAKTTETPIMEAITADLKEVFGNSIDKEIATLVVAGLMPLRGINTALETEPNRFLVIATKNILRDIVAVARVFQMTDQELRNLYPEIEPEKMREASLGNLSLSLLYRGLKGQARAAGFCAKEMHEEHIWMLRGLRDIPPGGLGVIGKFIDNKLISSK